MRIDYTATYEKDKDLQRFVSQGQVGRMSIFDIVKFAYKHGLEKGIQGGIEIGRQIERTESNERQ